jgi:hypothetical protein
VIAAPNRLTVWLPASYHRTLTAFCKRTGLNRAQVVRTLVFNFLCADYLVDGKAFVQFAHRHEDKTDGGTGLQVEMNATQYMRLSRYCCELSIFTGTVVSMLVFALIRHIKPGIIEDTFRLQASRLSAHAPSSPQWGTGEQQERKRIDQEFIARTFVEQNGRMSGAALSVALRGLGIRHSRKRVLFWQKEYCPCCGKLRILSKHRC